MKLRKRLMIALLFLAAALLFPAAIANQDQTLAAEYSCQAGSTCPNPSKCTGDHWLADGCKITCYKDSGTPGQIVFSGSANCGASDMEMQ